jgi:hypothetical protein
MAGRLEDEYWHASEAKAFNFDDDEVSVLYSFSYLKPKLKRRLICCV